LFFGLDGVLYSMPVSDVLTAIISFILIARTYKELNQASTPAETRCAESAG
jgi:hypothetical protein